MATTPAVVLAFAMLVACGTASAPRSATVPSAGTVAVPSAASVTVAPTAVISPTAAIAGSATAEPITFTDPFGYCAAIGTADAPDDLWSGVRVPAPIIDPVRANYGAAAKVDETNVLWRCMAGRVMRCFSWGTHYCGIQDESTNAPPRVVEYCRRQPDTDNAGGRATMGYATVYWWACRGGAPVISYRRITTDERGFDVNEWVQVTPPEAVSGPDDAMRVYLAQYYRIDPSHVVTGPTFAQCPDFNLQSNNVCFTLAEQRGDVRLYAFGYYATGAGSRFVVERGGQWIVLDKGCDLEGSAPCTWPAN